MNDCLIILCVTVLTKRISNNIQPVIIAENSNLSHDIEPDSNIGLLPAPSLWIG